MRDQIEKEVPKKVTKRVGEKENRHMNKPSRETKLRKK
jgi:hypothetical protein